MTAAIEITNLTKSYRGQLVLNGVSFSVKAGHVFALIGPNGAGKTTLVKCLLRAIYANGGQVKIHGQDFRSPKARQGLGYLPERFSYYPFYKVEDILQLFASLNGLKKEEKEYQIGLLSNHLGLQELWGKKARTLSKGELQKVGLAVAFMRACELVILDEPFSGLDPLAIRGLKKLMKSFRSEGKTVFLNSHLLGEIRDVVDSFALIHQGQLLDQRNIKDMKQGISLEDYFHEKIPKEGGPS